MSHLFLLGHIWVFGSAAINVFWNFLYVPFIKDSILNWGILGKFQNGLDMSK